MKSLRLLLLTLFLANVVLSEDKVGILMIGEIQNNEPDKTQDLYWTSTRVTASFSDGKMVIKSKMDLIPTPIGGFDELTLFGKKETKYEGGGSKMNKQDGRMPGVSGLNLMISLKPNGFYQGDGYMFYPTSGHNVHILLIFDGDK
jgi:hypothetical protein